MIDADAFLDQAAQRGISFYAGVPCSFLTPLINRVANSRTAAYVGAASEGEAVAIAAGAWLGGRGTAVLCQNSGLGNAVNPLTSLNQPFRIPTLLITIWRGEPGLKDEPQHELMGRITQDLLRVIEVPQRDFPREGAEIGPALDEACAASTAKVPAPWSGTAAWVSPPWTSAARRRRTRSLMATNSPSREPQSRSRAARVASEVVSGPGVSSSVLGKGGTSRRFSPSLASGPVRR